MYSQSETVAQLASCSGPPYFQQKLAISKGHAPAAMMLSSLVARSQLRMHANGGP